MFYKLPHVLSKLQAALLPDTWQLIEKCDVLLVRGDADCGYIYQGKAYAHLIDSIGDLFAKRGLVIQSVATPYSKLTGSHTHNSAVSFNRSAFIIGFLKKFFQLITSRAKGEEWAAKRLAHLWCRMLDKANPHYVIGIQPGVGLCRAGKMKGVPVYDLQHGVIADEHRWYGAKYRVNTPPGDLPDGFLCWDEPSAAALRKWAPQKGIDVRVIGNPWFSRFFFNDPSDLLVQSVINSEKIFNSAKPVILVSLQWGLALYYKNDGFNGVMADALEKAILETVDSYNWLIRLHPVQISGADKGTAQDYLKRVFGHLNSVDWCLCSELPLPVLLQQVDLHITDMSSVVVEAGWMGVYSALLNSHICTGGSLENIYAHERGLGLAEVLPQDTKMIRRWIAETLIKSKDASTLQNEGNALLTFIEEVLLAVVTDSKQTS